MPSESPPSSFSATQPPPSSPTPPSPTFEPTNGVKSHVLAALGGRPFARATYSKDTRTHDVLFTDSPPDQPARAVENAYGSPGSRGGGPAYISPPTRTGDPTYGSPPPILATTPPQHYPEEIRGGFSNVSPPTSPRFAQQVPTRSPPQREYQGLGAYLGGHSPRGRPVSMPIQYPSGLPGAHYSQSPPYGLRDASAAVHSRSSSRRAEDHDFHGFDTLPPPTDDGGVTELPVLLISAHQTLYAYEVRTESLKYHGHIEGLRGRVLSAKVVPVSPRSDKLRQLRPLVAVIVHGPYIPQQDIEHATGMDQSQHSEFDPSESVMQAMQTVAQGPVSETQYQTTVELYSLKERQHVATLYRSPIVDAQPIHGERRGLELPSPVGSLSIYAKGRFIVVASAMSGEVYIYATARDNTEAPISCIGKTWTGTPTRKSRSWSASSTSAASEADSQADASVSIDQPVLSLCQRWLAVMPPISSSKSTLDGTVDVLRGAKAPPGIDSHSPTPPPAANCELDTPFEDSRVNRVARDMAQELLKGAQWVGAQGKQAWKNYWSKPSDPPPTHEIPRSSRPTTQFPPTHSENMRTAPSPTVISILDLERLSDSQNVKPEVALQPIATFPLPDGCSFLSFNPTGLSLLTANTKGDVQYVWDLMRMVYPRPEAFAASSHIQGPLVRQIARFTRVTQAHIVDVTWKEPRGEKLAILTDRGTVHLHDMPASAFVWPPPRPKRPSPPKQLSADIPSTSGGWGSTLSSMTSAARPILAAARDTRISLSGLNISNAGVGASRQGSKMVATGFSKSVGAATGTVNSLRNMGETRLSIPTNSAKNIIPGTVRWLLVRDTTIISVVGDRKVQLYSVVSKKDTSSKTGRRYSAVSLRLAEHAVPTLKDPEARLPRDGILLGGYWPVLTPPRLQRGIRPPPTRPKPAPLSYAELESSAPFQPMHADKRVVLKTFEDGADLHLGRHVPDWAFGEVIPARRIDAPALHISGASGSQDPFFTSPVPAQRPSREHNDPFHAAGLHPLLSPGDDPEDAPLAAHPSFEADEDFDPSNPLAGVPDDEDEDMGPIASIIRPSGAERPDGAGFERVTVMSRPRKKKGKRETARGIVEGMDDEVE